MCLFFIFPSLAMGSKLFGEPRRFRAEFKVGMPGTACVCHALPLVLLLLIASAPFAATASIPGHVHPQSDEIANRKGGPVLYLPTADASALASGDADRTVRDAFLGPDAPGAMLVRGVPGYALARVEALQALAACAASARGKTGFVKASGGWGVEHGGHGLFTKHSVAATSGGRLPQALDTVCGPALRPKLEALRAAADTAAAAALPRLDWLLGYDTGNFFANAVASSGSLDHFHVYAKEAVGTGKESASEETGEKQAHDALGDSTLHYETTQRATQQPTQDPSVAPTSSAGKSEHMDVGVAIVMTPAFLWPGGQDSNQGREGTEDELLQFTSRGFTLGGKHPELPPDAVVVMLGEAARAWVPPAPFGVDAPEIKVPTHEMSLTFTREFGYDDSFGDQVDFHRAWFGRMVMPADDLKHHMHATTFGEWRDGVALAFGSGGKGEGDEDVKANFAVVSCSPRRKLADDSSCGAGKIYCWLSCVDDTADCATGESSKCVEPSTGLLWPDDLGAQAHCYTCQPTCVADPAAANGTETGGTSGSGTTATRAGGSTNPFCNDKIAPVSMYMDGFVGWSDPNGPCVAYLHRDLILSSPLLLFAAFFLTVLMGVSVEGLAAARRWRAKTQDAVCLDAMATGGHPVAVSMALKTQSLLLYGVQCSAGYLLMLVSMTYHAVLFIGVVVGLVIGHAWFNAAAPLGSRGGASACCQHVGTLAGGDEGNGAGGAPPLETRDLDLQVTDNDTSGGSGDDGSSLDSMNKGLVTKRRKSKGVEMTLGPDRV